MNLHRITYTVILYLVTVISLARCDDFYDLLGVSRGASDKEIRKAFKKLAITKHPDKNPNDPEAHDKFLKITRAYEVLKDEDLRKKYDMHGEEGLSDDFQGGRRYESWKFYQEEFGIYDDDPEIITLSRADFEQSVEGTDDVWFVNFYSPHCSHCHTLAPTWREVAHELEGVIRIGAINCQDDWHLCRMQGISSYPSLLMYPAREKYFGDKNRKDLVKFALKHVKVKVIELWSGNFAKLVGDSENNLPWLISFCGEGGDCLLSSTALKLAGLLDELANVATMDCHSSRNEALCEKLGQDYGTYFYQPGKIQKGEGLEITSLVAQEIANEVLSQLPDVTDVDQTMFEEIQQKLLTREDKSWLIHFVEGQEGRHLELRKLPAMLSDIKVGRIDCQRMRGTCNDLHIHKFPSFLVFKQSGGYEIYYGRITAHDVAAFSRDAAGIKLEALSPRDFESRRVGPSSHDAWFIDFFAPWCPPCMRLLPEFRKAAKNFGQVVNFGTVDCTIHVNLCRTYNVHSYPTTILYNQSKPHQYHGHHNVHALGEFIEDTLNPPVITLDYNQFRKEVRRKDDNVMWLVDFYAPWCGPCQQVAPEWRRLAKMLKNTKDVYVGMVDCVEHDTLCSSEQVNSYPNLRLYPPGTGHTGSYHQFNGWHRDAESLRAWAFDFLPSKVETVTWNKFRNDIMPSREPWIIDFFAPWCGHCQVFKPEFERVANDIEGIAKAGKVDCTSEKYLCQKAGIHAYPTVRFYQGSSKGGGSQNMYGWDVDSQNAEQIVQFVKNNSPKKIHSDHDEL